MSKTKSSIEDERKILIMMKLIDINDSNFCHALELDFSVIIKPLDKEFEELLIRINRINNN
jgi:hypothetical protein